MSKELEALERMAKYRFEEYGVDRDDGTSFYEDFDIIQQALVKAQEQDFNYNKIVIPFLNELVIILGINDMDEMLDKIKEQKQVFEIIKKKTVSIFQLSCCKNVNEYNDLKFNKYEKLIEEEFDLLKRWVKNGNSK